ncbi:MAG: type IV secretory system conjugative DNA transfer family protein, partial [Acidimicrobiales bacterium]
MGGQYNTWHNVTVTLGVVIAAMVLTMPFAVVGMALAWGVWKTVRPTWLTIVVFSVAFLAGVFVLSQGVAWLWPFGMLVPGAGPFVHDVPGVSRGPMSPFVWRSILIELQAGPMLLIAVESFLTVRDRTLGAGLWHQARGHTEGSTLESTLRRYASVVSPPPRSTPTGALGADRGHPPGHIRLGMEKDNRRKAFDVPASELNRHVFIPGTSGSGKTTTIVRIADGAIAAGYGLVIVDCKGGGLGSSARMLAARHGLPFILVDPDDPSSLGYNPCTGDGADVANKMIGAFTFGEAGEIYKQVAMRILPVLVRGLVAAGEPVTLASIADVCDQKAMEVLARKAGGALQKELLRLAAADGVGKAGYSSMEYRFGALLQGKFGPLFTKEPSLTWDDAMSTQSVVYISLPVTAASEDVELMGRVVAQDLKQVCSRRLQAVNRGEAVVPVLVAFDEFAALREAEQITDLLLQARQAELAVLLATQYLPEAIPILKAALSAGLLVVHRLEAQDSEAVAAQFGTRMAWGV